ncbi:glutathione S-transferase family protein [Hydrogenophaga sp. BPS33]|uniref:glutathione S-transferase family protein n=1 Tax=Hydrogenophaga sp. BPS33 TaxID=2651974 RepID=UPI0013200428|nr:glutathione S-transferase family protein [Hydrogenophaga sp. BPS33]QHE86063.1 glutathione S-transferase family protein [Hydrogenophaga sp. BPS33]
MPDLILHHYPMSPFAEKARLMLGHKGFSWQSVTIPSVMPKPDVLALTGGYRRTPLLQVGADIYCDTALICDVLEHRQPTPPLYPEHQKGVARVLAQWADSTLFWAAMGYALSPKGAAALFAKQAPEVGQAFAADRAAMRTGMVNLRAGDATAALRSYLRRLSTMVEEQPYLLGQAPCVADFAAYHPLWFIRVINPAMAGILEATPHVTEWLDRMAAIGHGTSSKITSTDAIAVAAAAQPAPLADDAFQDEHGIDLGSRVTVAAEVFGQEPTEGILRAATRTRYTLERTDARAGRLHVHFPRIGYVLREVRA